MSRKPNAFTLVELLVVIGVIALLISILLPALSKARAQSMRVKCLANLRTIMQGAMLYQVNNRGRFPYQPVYTHTTSGTSLIVAQWRDGDKDTSGDGTPEFNWVWFVHSMLKSQPAMLCPKHEGDLPRGVDRDNANSYKANPLLTQWGGLKVRESSNFVAFSEWLLPFEGSQHAPVPATSAAANWRTAYTWHSWMVGNAGTPQPANKLIGNRPHEGGRNYAFLDGHVEYRKWQDVTARNFGLEIAAGRLHEGEDVIGSNTIRAGKMLWP